MAITAVLCIRTATLPSSELKRDCGKSLKPHPVIRISPWLGSSMSISRHRNPRASNWCKAHPATAAYKVKLISPEGEEQEIDMPADAYVLESAENAGMDLPYSCRAGTCGTCAGLMVSGSVDQSEGSFLNESQVEKGYVLTCISRPTSDCIIHTHKESEVQ